MGLVKGFRFNSSVTNLIQVNNYHHSFFIIIIIKFFSFCLLEIVLNFFGVNLINRFLNHGHSFRKIKKSSL